MTLTSSDPTVGSSVTVSPGASVSAYFTITTSTVTSALVVAISATHNGITKAANLTVNPIAPASVTLSPNSVLGGASRLH